MSRLAPLHVQVHPTCMSKVIPHGYPGPPPGYLRSPFPLYIKSPPGNSSSPLWIFMSIPPGCVSLSLPGYLCQPLPRLLSSPLLDMQVHPSRYLCQVPLVGLMGVYPTEPSFNIYIAEGSSRFFHVVLVRRTLVIYACALPELLFCFVFLRSNIYIVVNKTLII